MARLYWLYTAISLSLAVWLLSQPSPVLGLGLCPRLGLSSLLALVLGSMAYDSFAIAISPHIGPGLLLQQLNRIRFSLHNLATPLLLVVGYQVLPQTPSAEWCGLGVWAIAVLLIAIGMGAEHSQPVPMPCEAKPIICRKTIRYRSPGFSPVPSITVTVILMLVGIQQLRLDHELGLLVSTLGIFSVQGVRREEIKLLLSPITELWLVLSLVTATTQI